MRLIWFAVAFPDALSPGHTWIINALDHKRLTFVVEKTILPQQKVLKADASDFFARWMIV
jgi:hypothetical protein